MTAALGATTTDDEPASPRPAIRSAGESSAAFAAALGVVLLGSTAPSPLYAVYRQQWGFTPTVLTVVFAVYAGALLAALLIFGRLSDHLGRRPVTLAALMVGEAATVVFLAADEVATLIVARVLQGLAAGLVTAAASSALVELETPGTGRGTLVSTVVPGASMAVGSLGAAALVQHAPMPARLVWWVLLGLGLLAIVAVGRAHETAPRRPGARASLRPQLQVPPALRAPFVAAVPGLVAVWALSAFYLSLGPTLARLLTGSGDAVLDATIVALLTGVGSLVAPALRRTSPPTGAAVGLALLLAGTVLTLVAVISAMPALLLVGSALSPRGFRARDIRRPTRRIFPEMRQGPVRTVGSCPRVVDTLHSRSEAGGSGKICSWRGSTTRRRSAAMLSSCTG